MNEIKEPKNNKPLSHKRWVLWILWVIPVGLIGFFLLFWLFPSTDKQKKVAVVQESAPSIQEELEKCNQLAMQYRWDEVRKQSCAHFMENWCAPLKVNYRMRERKSSLDRELGNRIPVLEQALDPVFPVNCYEQWWLTEADLFDLQIRPLETFSGFESSSPGYFAHKDSNGNLKMPGLYGIEKKYSPEDQVRLGKALEAAYKYSDINVAIREGYRMQPSFNSSMGIHLSNPSLFDETVEIEKPEFLTYIKSRWNNSYVLGQLGYIMGRNNNFKPFQYSLFDAPEAKGHNHFLVCYYVNERNWFKQITITDDPPNPKNKTIRLFVENLGIEVPMTLEQAKGIYAEVQKRKEGSAYEVDCLDSVWMLHVAVNLYNENGLFSDQFALINTMSKTGKIHSFFGRNFSLDDYELQS